MTLRPGVRGHRPRFLGPPAVPTAGNAERFRLRWGRDVLPASPAPQQPRPRPTPPAPACPPLTRGRVRTGLRCLFSPPSPHPRCPVEGLESSPWPQPHHGRARTPTGTRGPPPAGSTADLGLRSSTAVGPGAVTGGTTPAAAHSVDALATVQTW